MENGALAAINALEKIRERESTNLVHGLSKIACAIVVLKCCGATIGCTKCRVRIRVRVGGYWQSGAKMLCDFSMNGWSGCRVDS